MNSIFNFKKSKKILPSIDFSKIKCDLHSHLIPNIDDGSSSMTESITIIKGLQNLGFTKIITTPHIMKGVYNNDIKIIESGYKLLKDEIEKQKIDIDISVSAEYYLDFNFFELAKKKQILSFSDDFVLIELSFLDSPLNFYNIIFELQVLGYKIILAHPERYVYFELEDYKKLKSKNVFLQINLLSLIGYYNTNAQKKAELLIDCGMVDFVGTDIHNIRQLDMYSQVQISEYYHKLHEKGDLLNENL